MDFLKKAAAGAVSEYSHKNSSNEAQANSNSTSAQSQSNSEATSGILGKINGALGGGAEGEKKEGILDKAIDYAQEHVLKQGSQQNESVAEQAKDSAIADAVRGGFKQVTGKEFPKI